MTILFLQCKPNSDAQRNVDAGEEGTNVEETGNPARRRIKVKGGCTLLITPSFTLRGYSCGKDKTRWLGGLLVEHRTSVSQIRGSIPGQVAAV